MKKDGVRAGQAAATRAGIVAAAKRLFQAQGYADTPIDEIVAEAGVTRGALYHHFKDKGALFREVFHAVEHELMQRAEPPDVTGEADPWRRFRLRMQGFLDAIVAPSVHRVLLLDGPLVLGWAQWRTLEADYGLAAIGRALDAAMANGSVARAPVRALSHLILAAVDEAALMIAHAADRPAARAEAGQALDRFLAGIAVRPDI
ncbi:TetR family transcriptional regulator [Rhizorhabdus wittichii]|uniref:TetR family transcriptional regulator n=1 Tax=Rhizorhabdus wittichii TaxID=160791 RepID=A0A975HD92_9SPHN|nr:TetR family transcriptional regulator [Rhizorhabdus wittichii]QTH21180.1 TetR family transcriptional regulator [Rhizorhabdus wittichii]